MHFNILIYGLLFALPALAAPSPNAGGILSRANCGNKNGPCDKNGCAGTSNQDGSPGVCNAGVFKGCPCASTCNGSINSCQINGCNGVNFKCTEGKYKGCACK